MPFSQYIKDTDPNRIYKYVWTKNSVTLIRRDDTSEVIRVVNVMQLEELGITVSKKEINDAGVIRLSVR